MEEKDKMLDELFVLEDEAKDQSKKVNKEASTVKEEDLKSINKEASDLAKEFDKKNKENLNKLRKQEELRSEIEEDLENDQPSNRRKSKVSFLLSLLSFPFVVLGGVIIWDKFFAVSSINPLAILTVLMCVSSFSIGVKSFTVGVMKKGVFKRKIKPLAIGLLGVCVSVAIILLKEYIEPNAFAVFGAISALLGIIAVFAMAFKHEKKKMDIVKIVMSGLSIVASVLLILAGLLWADVLVYMQISGIYLALVGCALFIF
jgi:hypothetical protein